MNLELRAEGVLSNADVERFVQCRVELALGSLRDRLDSTNVFVERREGVARNERVRCLVVLQSGTRPDVFVERFHSNLYVAIHLAIDQAGWALADSCVREQNTYLDQQLEVLCQRRPPKDVRQAQLSGQAA